MFSRMRMLLPWVWITGIYIALILLINAMEFFSPRPDPIYEQLSTVDPSHEILAEMFQRVRLVFVVLIACVLGGNRVIGYHPFYRPVYRQWLSFTPWRVGQPLPLGPVHLVWEDAVIFAVFVAVGLASPVFPMSDEQWLFAFRAAAIAFLFAHVSLLAFVNARMRWTLIFFFVLLPLTVYPAFDYNVALLVLAVIYGFEAFVTRQALREFPFDDSNWNADPNRHYLDEAITKKILNWPWDTVGPREHQRHLTWLEITACAGLFAWYMHAMVGIELPVGDPFTWSQFVDAYVHANTYPIELQLVGSVGDGIAMAIAAVRFIYYRYIAAPPISLLGRIRTGRLIIPGYDAMYVVPLCVLAYGFYAPRLLYLAGCPDVLFVFVLAFGGMWLALTPWPSIYAWRYTAHARYRATLSQAAMAAPANSSAHWQNTQIRVTSRGLQVERPVRK